MTDESILRQEIIGTEKSRADFQKWKLVLVASLGAVALGLGGTGSNKSYELLLCGIPLVCGYVDLLCTHMSLRILVIASYLRAAGDNYELFVERQRTGANPFVLEDWVMYGSTVILSVAVGIYGPATHQPIRWPYPLSGLLGLFMAAMTFLVGEFKKGQLKSARLNDSEAPSSH